MKNYKNIELLICPSCAGQMSLGEFRPGDKIARCNYCGKVIDLPDNDGPENQSTTTETESIEKGKNYYRKTTSRVTRSSISSADLTPFEDLFKDQFNMNKSETTITRNGVEIAPEEIEKLLQELPGGFSIGEKGLVKTKRSFLSRVFKIEN